MTLDRRSTPISAAPRGRQAASPAWLIGWHGVLSLLLGCGCSLAMPQSQDLQAMLNAAAPGDTIVLPAGTVYTGNFILPKKNGSATITIISSEASALPAGARVQPADKAHMATIRSANNVPPLTATAGAHNYKLVGLEITSDHYNDGLVTLGIGTETSVDQLPRDIELDRVYIHGDPLLGSKRGVALNGLSVSVHDSYISDIKGVGQDTQAICGWSGPGPFQIVNNYLEAAGENILFGGATSPIQGMVPSDVEIRGNYFFKPLSWKKSDPSYDGKNWSVKNLLELKNIQRAHIAGNILENNWAAAQDGFGVLFTVRTQDDTAPWSVVQDVTFENNWIRNVDAGVNMLGQDGSGRSRRITIRNNLWTAVGGTLFQILTDMEDLTIEHNTAFNRGAPLKMDGLPSLRVVFRSNVCANGPYGIGGTNASPGNGAIKQYLPDAVIANNLVIGADARVNPAHNFYPASADMVVFRNLDHGDYRLAAKSPYRNAGSDGQDIGANIGVILQAVAATVQGR